MIRDAGQSLAHWLTFPFGSRARTGGQRRGESIRQEPAETLALRALTWLLADRDLTGRFLDASGASPGTLAEGAGDPQFLGAVLDFLLTEDALVTGFCDASGYDYAAPMQARAALPGGEMRHWT